MNKLVRWTSATLIVMGAALCVGCDDESGGGGGGAVDAGGDGGQTSGQGDTGQVEDTGAADSAAQQDSAAVDTAPPPDTTPPECTPNTRRCDGEDAWEICLPEGRWNREVCDEGFTCQEPGECVPDAANCVAGERICLTNTSPAECVPGEDWRPLLPCEDDELCVEGECRSRACGEAAQTASYLGCDYVTTDLQNLAWAPIGGTPSAPMGLVVANPSPTASVSVSLFDATGAVAPLVREVTIAPPPVVLPAPTPVTVRTEVWDGSGRLANANFGQAQNLEIPAAGMAILLLEHHGYRATSVVAQEAWRVRADQPVAAYQFSPYCCNYSFTNDASLLIPTPALGTEYMYVGVPSWGDRPMDDGSGMGTVVGYPATLTVIATRSGTDVEVALPAGVGVKPDQDGRIQIQGQTVTARLDAQEVLHLFSNDPTPRGLDFPRGVDMSGARVTASKPVAAFSGHECSFYPQDQGACDHLEEQLLPMDTWGVEYALIPPVLRAQNLNVATEAIFWKIIASEPNTRIELSVPMADLDPRAPGFDGVPHCLDRMDGPQTIVLGAGEYCEFGTRTAATIRANEPVSVMGIISGQDSTGTFMPFGAHAGDPAIFILPPQYQFRNAYAFLAPTTYFNDVMTVVTVEGATIELDGEPVDLSGATPVAGSRMVYQHVSIEDGPHSVSADRPFGLLVFAYDDYVSYAFTGGLNLLKRP